MREPRRYLGLELAGAKTEKTAVAALEYYPKENKIFLLDIFERIAAHDEQSGDEALLETIEELREGVQKIGVNVPLTLPPCIGCTRAVCPLPGKCTVPAVKWMRELSRLRSRGRAKKQVRGRQFTPYTQRPFELYVRHQIFPEWTEHHSAPFEIDEALGGARAPLTARMHFLQRHWKNLQLVEVWPKLSVQILARGLGVSSRTLAVYRHLEQGAHARGEILEKLTDAMGVFVYERDLRKLSASLAAFDAFLCAFTALLSDLGRTARAPAGYPPHAGWVEFPKLR